MNCPIGSPYCGEVNKKGVKAYALTPFTL